MSNLVIDQAGARFLLFGEPLAPGLLVHAICLYLSFDAILDGALWRDALHRQNKSLSEKILLP